MMTAPEIGNVGRQPRGLRVGASVLRRLRGAQPLAARVELARRGRPRRLHGQVRAWPASPASTPVPSRAACASAVPSARSSRARWTTRPAPSSARASIRRSKGRDLVKEVTSAKPYDWDEGLWQTPGSPRQDPPVRHRVVAYDFGIKRGILRRLRHAGCAVSVVPAQTPAKDVLAAEAGRHLPVQRPRRSRGGRVRRRRRGRAVRQRQAHLRHLPRAPDPGPRPGRQDLQAQVRPPRRQPSGDGSDHAQGRDHLAEPRLRRRRRFAGRQGRADPHQPERPTPSRACATIACPSSACSTTPKRRPDRTIRATCSIASSS